MKNTRQKTSGFTLIELLIVVVIVGIVIGLVFSSFKFFQSSDGSRIGVISKLSYKGAFDMTKSWEGEMYVDTGSLVNRDIWKFSITPGNWKVEIDSKAREVSMDREAVNKLVEKLQQYKRGELKLELFYHEKFTPPWIADTRYRIVDVMPISNSSTRRLEPEPGR